MRHVARLLVLVSLAALVVTGMATAGHLEPKKRFTAADQARARAMLLKRTDFGPGYATQPPSGSDGEIDCAGLDESDLTLTGEAESATFSAGLTFISSVAQVFRSVREADAAWKRETRTAGTKCLRESLRRELAKGGVRVQSLKKLPFPRIAQRTVAYRVSLLVGPRGQEVRAFVDVVALMHSRAQAAVFLGSGLAPTERAEELRLGRRVAKRMAAAMRGG